MNDYVGINPATGKEWTSEYAVKEAEDFVNERLRVAKKLMNESKMARNTKEEKTRKEKWALRELGQAFHTIMDSTSPAHTDANGWPVAYEGANIKLHSPSENTGIENAVAIAADDKRMTMTVNRLKAAMVAFNSETRFDFPIPGR